VTGSVFIRLAYLAAIAASLGAAGCGLFQTRTPEAPTQPSDSFKPATDPDVLVENLQAAIAEKNSVNYLRCLSDPVRSKRTFLFTPSSGAAAVYASVFSAWSLDEERQYFQNLVSRTSGNVNAYSNLVLFNKAAIVTSDSAVHTYDYTLTFDHNEPTFPTTAAGTMQLVMIPDNTNAWVICRWTDFKSTSEVTWSHFKGKFSN
jgi:hypothetical protein